MPLTTQIRGLQLSLLQVRRNAKKCNVRWRVGNKSVNPRLKEVMVAVIAETSSGKSVFRGSPSWEEASRMDLHSY